MLATVGDGKQPIAGSEGLIDHYEANLVSAQDYYPFGMMMSGRKWSAGGGYRYGFNGKENDNEIKGEGNELDFGARIYDPRIGRFLSLDPLSRKYPGINNYSYALNSPIRLIDVDGEEPGDPMIVQGRKGQHRLATERSLGSSLNVGVFARDWEVQGLNALRQEIKDSTTANNGKMRPEDQQTLQKIKTQEKAIGERNKQKRKK
ncbi:RHS repeat-associated core domain-containing protein [Chitinophaga sp. G-6-1-13]|uniref:RHS repeat-associated core domain-containing protein n=1 Tax=Chitinophaga fulva TaxID=2728842 RepID=A0A848GIJ0_9BACT|nr:RHS repeat-associated core domain-containing protein [Chitinophaga fulva]NML38405.1 RHS repeat-associated core domain-containing protein [Chitinophaga fulva]